MHPIQNHPSVGQGSALVSRRNVASVVKDRTAIAKFPIFMDDIRRAILTPTQKLGCELLAEDSLQRGFYSVWYRKLEDLVLDAPGEPPRANLAPNDLTPLFKQLGDLRIIRAEWSARSGWYVLILPDSNGWDVRWHRSACRRTVRWMHLDGLRRVAAPFLPEFAPDADLYDALAQASATGNDIGAGVPPAANVEAGRPVASRHGPVIDSATAFRRSVASQISIPDAPEVPPMAGRGFHACRHSGIQNADSPAKLGSILNSRMRTATTRARLSNLDSGFGHKAGQNNPNWLGSFRREELKEKLQGDQREFCFVAKLIIGDEAWSIGTNGHKPDAIRWTLRFKAAGNHRATARAVFAEMLTSDFVALKTNAAAAENLWEQFGGRALDSDRWKNLRNLLNK